MRKDAQNYGNKDKEKNSAIRDAVNKLLNSEERQMWNQFFVLDVSHSQEIKYINVYLPDRYNHKLSKKNYRYINIYKIYDTHLELIIENVNNPQVSLSCLLEKNLLSLISEYHWSSSGLRIPCTSIDGKLLTIGQFIGNPHFRNHGKIKNKPVFDFRKGMYGRSGNTYTDIDSTTMKLKILKNLSKSYYVIFDKEDYGVIKNHAWRVEFDSKTNTECVLTKIDDTVVLMHRHIFNGSDVPLVQKAFRDIIPIDNTFDFRKSVMTKKMLNIYEQIDDNTIELTINSVHGRVQILLDKEDCDKVSELSWAYKKNGNNWRVRNYKVGSLKEYILGKESEKYRYLKIPKTESGAFDFRKKTLKNFNTKA